MIHKLLRKTHIKTIGVLFIGILLVFASFPVHSEAAGVKTKSKVVYNISVSNINSDTVIKKGNRLKIQCNATKTKNGIVKGTKVKFRSSNKKVATVSSKGVIKAKKNGTVKITVYCKSKPSKKKTIKIRVGTPVSSIKVSGYQHLNAGRTSSIKAKPNSNATNKKILWKSDNPSIVRVDGYGKIKAIKNGTATIFAVAADGSGTKGSLKISVHKYTSNEAKWVAHRGLHTSVTENTKEAFIAAGEARGFWGCECDIWETKHEIITETVTPNAASNAPSSDDVSEQPVAEPELNVMEEEPPAEIEEADVSAAPATGGEEAEIEVNEETETETAEPEESVETPETIVTEQAARSDEAEVIERDSFDIVINHDDTFARTQGRNIAVKSMTASEIRTQLPKVCFFDEYLDICKQYNMVPVVEFKDWQMSDAAIEKAIEMLDERGQLQDALLISFYPNILQKAKAIADSRLNGRLAYTAFLTGEKDIRNAQNITKQMGFGCVSVHFGHLDKQAYDRCTADGLTVGTWTYGESAYSDEMLYRHVLSGQYGLSFVTVDYKPW